LPTDPDLARPVIKFLASSEAADAIEKSGLAFFPAPLEVVSVTDVFRSEVPAEEQANDMPGLRRRMSLP
jgi:hypothetical protein